MGNILLLCDMWKFIFEKSKGSFLNLASHDSIFIFDKSAMWWIRCTVIYFDELEGCGVYMSYMTIVFVDKNRNGLGQLIDAFSTEIKVMFIAFYNFRVEELTS